MPRYVEDQFVKASQEIGLKVEPRADGLWRIEHVLADLRSERLRSVRRMGKPEPPTASSPSTRSISTRISTSTPFSSARATRSTPP